ncbi:AraC-type DNA-binding protein [Chryseobacterium oleae]|uniref:AraC-type DNA-binding protein n=1 Tax=Chryseobacterium oleae TaxID=491207 RepID=A0A1I4XFD2_CHROL|nr:AraC family transcriptional regulator [Chryseobacterium oleae]SFN24617.1 AraC-type DNA-binding protein [Chryseobacterium oleae]
MKKNYLLFFLCFFGLLFSQAETLSDYYKIKEKYINNEENDSSVFPYLNMYIAKAKKEKNYEQLTQAYKDGVFFASTREQKLQYADSTISAALLSKDSDIIGDAYLGKGIVYYFNFKKYKMALNEYLKAYRFSENTKDNYLKYRVIYHLGVVKSYLGYYDEALKHFNEATDYFESQIRKNTHPNIIFNNKKGYYNGLHQMIVCYRNLSDFRKADLSIKTGLKETYHSDFKQERGYFLKEAGIEEYRKKNYKKSLELLNESLPAIQHINDFAWATVDYFYMGKSYWAEDNQAQAIANFQKVDSVFEKHKFILPELRENYELLINYYKNKKDTEKELYYTKQLLRADSVLSQDFTYLSHKIHKEYDTQTLIKEKQRLEWETSWGSFIIIGLVVIALGLCAILVIRYRHEKEIISKYKILEERIIGVQEQRSIPETNTFEPEIHKSGLDKKLIEDILIKLKNFEEKNGFTEQGLTLNKLAQKFDTNSNYLSQIINDFKETNFNRYLSELRITFITTKLYNDKIFLSYKIETLAEKCGIASRSNFSNLFYEFNGIRPTDFIKQRKQETENGDKRQG